MDGLRRNIAELRRERYALSIMERLMENDADARSKPEYLDTWAAAHAANGNFDRAISLQELALEVAQADQYAAVREVLEEHLEIFKSGELITEKAP